MTPTPQIAIFVILFLSLSSLSCDNGVDIRPLDSSEDSGCLPALSNDYILPYPIGESYRLAQGNCGDFDHDLDIRYAYDFEMPIGTIVTAIQDGTVIFTEERFPDGSKEQSTVNQVLIEHENGTTARYLNLTREGALVEPGDIVRRGDTIALSGNTGFIPAPQLHIDVGRCGITCATFKTIAIGFLNASPSVVDSEGENYLATEF